MPRKLTMETAQRLESKADLIQRAAHHTATQNLFSIDLDKTLTTDIQLAALVDRVRSHIEEVLSAEEMGQIAALSDGVKDCEFALRGMRRATDQTRPGKYSPREKGDIARRSYNVLRKSVTNRHWIYWVDNVKMIDPNYLELVEEPVPFVRVRSATEGDPTHDYVPCPAFLGDSGRHLHLPRQLWPKIVDIYEECGEFGLVDGDILVPAGRTISEE
jgi:hypothetical protein